METKEKREKNICEPLISGQWEEYLQAFIERALPPEEITNAKKGSKQKKRVMAKGYLKKRIDDHSVILLEDGSTDSEYRNLIIHFSQFVYSFSSLDPNSGNRLTRISRCIITNKGIRVHNKKTVLICYTLQGEGEIVIRGEKQLSARKYDCFMFDCSYPIDLQPLGDEPWECAFVRIQDGIQSEYFQEVKLQLERNCFLKLVYGSGTRFRSLIWQLLSVKTAQNVHADKYYNLLLMGLFLELEMSVLHTGIPTRNIPSYIRNMRKYMDQYYMEDLSLDSLAERFNISKYHMSREFKKYTGITPNDYIINRRINHAKELLLETDQSIAAIAETVGVNNPNHFLYLFKNKEGMTPSAFRKKSSYF